MSRERYTPASGVVPKKLLQGQLGALQDLSQRGPLHLTGMVGHREMNCGVCRAGEIVMASLGVVQDVSRVLESANDLPRFEGGNAGRHTALDGDRNALGDRTSKLGSSLPGNGLSTLS